jgi:hypothetical protein
MAVDFSQELGAAQLAATPVCPRGHAWRQAASPNYSLQAMALGPLAARIVFGPRPDPDPAQTPQFGQIAWLAVTGEEIALVRRTKTRSGVTFRAYARVPLDEVRAFDLGHARMVWPLTVTLRDGSTWRLEIPRFSKKRATAVAAAVSPLLQRP